MLVFGNRHVGFASRYEYSRELDKRARDVLGAPRASLSRLRAFARSSLPVHHASLGLPAQSNSDR